MPLPVATRIVHLDIVNDDTGEPGVGHVQFVRPALTDVTDAVLAAGAVHKAILGTTDEREVQTPALEAGQAYIALPVNDEAGVGPEDFEYGVRVRLSSPRWSDDGVCAVPTGDLSELEFTDIYSSDRVAPEPGVTYATVAALASHAADDELHADPDALVVSVNGETGVVTLSAADVGAADTSHAADHGFGGSDIVEVDTSQVTGLDFSLAGLTNGLLVRAQAFVWAEGFGYELAAGAGIYVGPTDPGAVPDGSVWFDTSA